MRLILSQQEDNCILPAQIPNNVRVEHKTGELDGVYHDCGIVYKPGHPYICCIMTEGFTDEPQALYDLSYVARDIYDEV
jgi:beta-lactamase class A